MRDSDEAGEPLLPSGSDTTGRGGRLAPPEHASAKEVQEHIMRMLHHVCDLPTAAAVNIAAQWTMGTGQDLLSCDADACRAIFGAEAGSIIYHRSRRDRLVARHGEGRLGTMEAHCEASPNEYRWWTIEGRYFRITKEETMAEAKYENWNDVVGGYMAGAC